MHKYIDQILVIKLRPTLAYFSLRFSLLPNGSLVLSKLLHGHVSRVRSIDVQNGRILSGSDDRSLKVGNKLN